MKRRDFLCALALVALLGGCGKEIRFPAVAPGKTVLAFGDSVTFGTGAAPGEDWPALLALRTGWNVVNAGIPGDTAESARERLRPLLKRHNPALLIIEIGGNDFLRRRSPRAVKEDIRRMIHAANQASIPVALLAVPELSVLGVVARRLSDAAIYRELSEEELVPLIPGVFADILARPELCADQIHPNALGYQQMAAGIYASLQKVGLTPAVR